MNTEETMQLIHDICIANVAYLEAKERRENVEDTEILTNNWNKINDNRASEDLPPIKNESQRKAYIRVLTADYKHREECKLIELNQLKMIYENREIVNYSKD